MSERKTVGIKDLEQFLTGKNVAPRNEAGTIWSLLIYNSTNYGSGGLPLDLTCDTCGKEFGECKHNSYIHHIFKRMDYNPKQGKHWRIELKSLRRARLALEDMEIRMLGAPEKPGRRRRALYAWIDSL